MTGPITQPPGDPTPTVPPKPAPMHRHPSGRACADGKLLFALARAVLAELQIRSLAYEPHIDVTRPYAVVDGVHGWVTA